MAAADYANVVQQLYVSYFGRPADYYGLQNFEAQLNAMGAPTTVAGIAAAVQAGTNVALVKLVNSFNAAPESVALYGAGTTQIEISKFVAGVYTNVLGRPADVAGANWWINEIVSGRLTKANAALAISAGALTNTTAQGVIDAATITAKVAVATDFTTSLDTIPEINAFSGDAAAAAARAMLATVTNTTTVATFHATVDATIAGLGTAAAAGQTFTLTKDVIDNIVGTSGNDTIIGDAVSTSAADQVNGGAGTDTLKLVGTTTKPTISNIENIVLDQAAAQSSFDASTIAGVTGLTLQNHTTNTGATLLTVGAGQALTLNNVQKTASYLQVSAAASVTSASITLDKAGDAATAGTALDIELEATGVKTLNLATANNASRIALLDAQNAVNFNVETINITGDKNLTASVAASSATKVTIAAGTFTGNLNLDLSATEDFVVTGGTGADRFNFSSALTAADKVAGGAGIDTLATSTATVDATFAAIVDSKTATVNNNSSIEVLEYTGTASYVVDASIIQLAGLTTYSTTGAIVGTVGAAAAGAVNGTVGLAGVAVTGESNAQAFSFEAAVTGGVGGAAIATLNGGNGGAGLSFVPTVNNGANVVSLTLKGVAVTGGAGGAGTGGVVAGSGGAGADFTNFETVNIVSTGATATAVNSFVGGAAGAAGSTNTAVAGSSIIASTNTLFNISGANEINLGTISSGNQPVTINASALTGKMTVGTGTGADVITGGSGVNLIMLAGGADTINLSASVAKADVITFTGATNTSATALVSITGFTNAATTGDKLDTAITTVAIQADVATGTATGVTSLTGGVSNGILSFAGSAAATATLADKVAAAASSLFAGAVNEVLAFEHAGSTYVFAQVGTADAFNAGTDQVIQLVGVTGLTSLSSVASGANALFIA